jgi:WD40 repeat protein
MMTNNHDEPFYPERVDEQIGQLSQIAPQSPHHTTSDMRMIQDLRTISTDYTRSGERVHSRLVTHMARRDATSSSGLQTHERFLQEGMRFMQTPYPTNDHAKGKIRKRISLIAATLVAALLVGLLVATLTLGHNHQRPSVATGQTPTPTATATPVPPGTIVHTQSPMPGTSLGMSVAWSPDSTRIATLAFSARSEQEQLQIWDATTGGHLLNVPLDNSFDTILWSPAGKYLALSTLSTIEIIDSQSGKLVDTIPYNQPAIPQSAITGRSPLASLMPAGGGFGFYSMAWTPDGTSLAVNVSDITTGKVELINPVTGAVNKVFSARASSVGMSLAFSSDGQYLAAAYYNISRVVVWNVATKAVVFERDDFQVTDLAWQPGTHNLARAVLYPSEVQLWDIPANKLLKTYPGNNSFAWSPDGKELATYVSLMNEAFPPAKKQAGKITILKATSGGQVAVYTSQNKSIANVVWSPDGRYLASTENNYVPGSTTLSDNRIIIRAV